MNFSDAFGERKISFGDQVRIVSTELTENLGFAGLVGTVFGQTIPSTSGVEDVIGLSDEDYAVNVFFDERDEGVWFSEELLELVSRNLGQKITIDGVDAVFTLDDSGRWKGEGHGLVKQQSWWQRFKSLFKPG
ncbi:MAG: hypothetical protein C0508_17235 [Cyanobacteria bacterium PR.023]|nr:hypothetical protein [Cyanobacteria bacterium PR.023]